MKRVLLFLLLALLPLFLPELAVDPFRAEQACSWLHPLGTDGMGRDAALRLLIATARSVGFASAVGLGALAVGLLLSLGRGFWPGVRSALRAVPPLLILLSLGAFQGAFHWFAMGGLLALLLGLNLEPPLRAKLEPFTQGPAWAMDRVLGARWPSRLRLWTPWAVEQVVPFFPSLWLGALWGETTLRLLGLGPGPHIDSLGLLLNEEWPRLSTDGTALGWASLALVLALTLFTAFQTSEEIP